jgi:hypothetical protein
LSKLLDNTFDNNSAYKSDSSRQLYCRPKKYLQLVQEIINKFIDVRFVDVQVKDLLQHYVAQARRVDRQQ